MNRRLTPLAYATALARLPAECRPLGLRIVPPRWRALVEYMVLVYMPALARLRRAQDARRGVRPVAPATGARRD